jgi:hypothetical protein
MAKPAKKAARATARTSAKKAAPRGRRKATLKGRRKAAPKGSKKAAPKELEHLIFQAMSDQAFIKQLEADPEAALRANGYPASRALVKSIKSIDFRAFRALGKGGDLKFC